VQLADSLIGFGNVPFFTQPQIVLGATPPAISLHCGRRKNRVVCELFDCIAFAPFAPELAGEQ